MRSSLSSTLLPDHQHLNIVWLWVAPRKTIARIFHLSINQLCTSQITKRWTTYRSDEAWSSIIWICFATEMAISFKSVTPRGITVYPLNRTLPASLQIRVMPKNLCQLAGPLNLNYVIQCNLFYSQLKPHHRVELRVEWKSMLSPAVKANWDF